MIAGMDPPLNEKKMKCFLNCSWKKILCQNSWNTVNTWNMGRLLFRFQIVYQSVLFCALQIFNEDELEERIQQIKRQCSDDRPSYGYRPPQHDGGYQVKRQRPNSKLPAGWLDCPALDRK